jgi:hypothetical protein
MLASKPKASTAAWRASLKEQDKTNPEDWK